jgi:GAF domain-containing protein
MAHLQAEWRETGEPILFENLQTDPRYQELSQTKDAQQRDCCFFAIFPIKSKQRFLGTINCLGKQPRQLIAEEIRLIRSMCDQIGVAVNLFEEVRNKTGELELSNSGLREALEQQTATSEILRVIASSPTDLQPVLDTVAESAARLCDSVDAQIWRVEGDMQRKVASYGVVSSVLGVGEARPIRRGSASGRAILDRQPVHIHGILAEREEDYEDIWRSVERQGIRTGLAVPLMREDVPIGAITISANRGSPFYGETDCPSQDLRRPSGDCHRKRPAVQGDRRAERRVTEALEHQTATAEVLGIISRSPTDVQPVLDAIVESTARVCGIEDVVLRLQDRNFMVPRAHFGPVRIPSDRSTIMDETVRIFLVLRQMRE